MDVKGEVAVTLQNMKEHFTWQSPLGFLPLFALTVKILTQEGESKLHFTLMYQTLCPFELLILLEGEYVLDTGYPQVFFYTSSAAVPVEPICGCLQIASSKLFPVGTVMQPRAKEETEWLLVKHLASGLAATFSGFS